MPRAQNALIETSYQTETVPGTTDAPTGAWLNVRKNSEKVAGTQGNIESGEIRSDRQSASDIQGNKNVGGPITTELSSDSHDDFLLSALFANAWTTTDSGSIALDITGGVNALSRVAGDFVADGFIVGQFVELSGFSNAINNGWFKVTAVVALSMTLAGAALVTESGGGDERAHAKFAKGGKDPYSMSVRKRYTDIGEWVIFSGCLVADMSFSLAPEAVVGLNFTMNGRDETDRSSAVVSAATDVSTSDPFDSFSGSVLLDNVVNNNVTSLNVSLANNLDDMFVVGSRFKVDQSAGRQLITGDIGFYFNDLSEYEASVAHTAKSVDVSMSDGTNHYAIGMPRSYYDLETPSTEDEGPSSLKGPFRAKLDATLGSTMIISRSIT